ncbi:hypothetical protein [Pseudochryseolinea flava]|nr:hypothetical protein [Pseudochryseolinea flava]
MTAKSFVPNGPALLTGLGPRIIPVFNCSRDGHEYSAAFNSEWWMCSEA